MGAFLVNDNLLTDKNLIREMWTDHFKAFGTPSENGGGTFYSLLVTRRSLEIYSLLNEKSLVTRCITYSLSLQNLLVIIQKLARYQYKPTRCNSKPTRYH